MKFIRDIISEKRSLSPATAPLSPAAATLSSIPKAGLPPEPPLAVSVEALHVAEAAPDFVVNLFPEFGDDSDGPQDSLFTADQDYEDETAAPISARPDQAFRTIRAAPVAEASLRAAEEEDAASEALPEATPTVSPFAALRAASTARPLAQPRLDEMPFVSATPPAVLPEAASSSAIEVPAPAAGRGANRSGRVKTRLLGFDAESAGLANPFEKPASRASDPFPVGWLVVVAGPGRGAAFALHDGVSRIGRGEDQTVCLNFGDNSISRENHVLIAYDQEASGFFIGQSGRSNIVRLNNKPLLSTEQIRSGDQIRVGETTLRLAALCGEDFSWTAKA